MPWMGKAAFRDGEGRSQGWGRCVLMRINLGTTAIFLTEVLCKLSEQHVAAELPF